MQATQVASRCSAGYVPGAGVADDKVIYAYVPAITKYYLGEEPLLPNVPTYVCLEKQARDHVIANLDKMVVRPANESGGYGMLIGPHASKREREKFKRLIRKDPRNYIAQPLVSLSTTPTLVACRSFLATSATKRGAASASGTIATPHRRGGSAVAQTARLA